MSGNGTDTDQGLKLWEEIHLTLKGMKHWTDYQIAKERKRLNQMGKTAMIPGDIRLKGQATVASTIAVVPVASPTGSPDQGHVWIVRNVSIGRGDAALGTGAGGNGYLVVRPSPPGGQLPTAANLDWEGVKDAYVLSATVIGRQYSSRQVVVKAEEYVYIVVTGGTNGQVIFAQVDVEDVQESAGKQTFEI